MASRSAGRDNLLHQQRQNYARLQQLSQETSEQASSRRRQEAEQRRQRRRALAVKRGHEVTPTLPQDDATNAIAPGTMKPLISDFILMLLDNWKCRGYFDTSRTSFEFPLIS